MYSTQSQNQYALCRRCRSLAVQVSQRPGSTKLLLGVVFWALDEIAKLPDSDRIFSKILPVLERSAAYKQRPRPVVRASH